MDGSIPKTESEQIFRTTLLFAYANYSFICLLPTRTCRAWMAQQRNSAGGRGKQQRPDVGYCCCILYCNKLQPYPHKIYASNGALLVVTINMPHFQDSRPVLTTDVRPWPKAKFSGLGLGMWGLGLACQRLVNNVLPLKLSSCMSHDAFDLCQ